MRQLFSAKINSYKHSHTNYRQYLFNIVVTRQFQIKYKTKSNNQVRIVCKKCFKPKKLLSDHFDNLVLFLLI